MDSPQRERNKGGAPAPTASWLPLSFVIQGGGLLAKLATQTSAPSSWHAVRNAKELLRSERRAWHSFGVYRRLGLPDRSWGMHASAAAAAAVGDSSAADPSAATAANHAGPGSVSCSTRDYGSNSCSSSSCSEHDSTCSSSLRSLCLPLHKQQQQQQQQQREAAEGRTVDGSMERRMSDAEETSVSDSDDSSSSVISGTDYTSASGVHTPGCSEEGRSLPAAASSLLRFPRIFPGYHFPPQPSAVPSAFFHPHNSSSNSSSSSSSDSSSSSNSRKCSAAVEAAEPQIVPSSRIQLLQCMLADTAAATIQRCIRGYFTRLRFHAALVWRRLLQQQQQREHRAAVCIQSAWRRAAAREQYFQRKTEAQIALKRQKAAVKLQALWRMHAQQFAFETERLTRCLLAVRRLAAIEIQRAWRGRAARKILDEEWEAWVIKWVWDKPSAIVEVIGDFSSPPWTKRHLMTYCHIRECFVLALPRRPGRHELKFIVNGRYVCDGSQTVIADGSGHFNNLVRVRPSAPSQFRLIRQRLAAIDLKRKALERSTSSPALSGVARPQGFFQQQQQQKQQQQKLERFMAYTPSNRARRMSIHQDFLPPPHKVQQQQQQHQQQHQQQEQQKQQQQQQQRAEGGEDKTGALGGTLPLLEPEPPPSSSSAAAAAESEAAEAAAAAAASSSGGLERGAVDEGSSVGPESVYSSSANLARSWQLTSVCGGSDAIQRSRTSSLASDISRETTPERSLSQPQEEGPPNNNNQEVMEAPPSSLSSSEKQEENTEGDFPQGAPSSFKEGEGGAPTETGGKKGGAPLAREDYEPESQQTLGEATPKNEPPALLPDTDAAVEISSSSSSSGNSSKSSSSSSNSSKSRGGKEETQQAESPLKETDRENDNSNREQEVEPQRALSALVSPSGASKKGDETHAAPKDQQQQGEDAARSELEKEGPPSNLIVEGPGPPSNPQKDQLLPAAAAAAAAAPWKQEEPAAARGPVSSSAHRGSAAAAAATGAAETTPFYTPRDASEETTGAPAAAAPAAAAAAAGGRVHGQPKGRGGGRRGHRRK